MAEDAAPDGLAEVAEELYGLDPGEFTTVRNDRAAALRAEDRALSDRVKQLRKPTTSAWVVNLLVRHEADQMTQMLDVGEALRQAAADLDADAMRELARQRRRLVNAVAGEGRRLAREHGTRISEQVLRQVEDTLQAAMIDADAAAAVRTGLLLDALNPAGVGSLKVATAVADHTALGKGCARSAGGRTASAGRGGASRSGDGSGRRAATKRALSAVPERDPAEVERERQEEERARRAEQRAAARAAVDEARSELDAAEEQRGARRQQVADLQASALQLNGELDELRRRIAELEDRLETVDEELDDATAAEEQASGRAEEARQAFDRARAALEEIPDD